MEKLISEFSVGLFFWQTILFLALVFLLRKYAWRPILREINQREEFIENSLEQAKEAERQLKELQQKNDEMMKEGYAQRDKLIAEARETKDKLIAEAKNRAKEEADRILVGAREEIRNEKVKAIEELKGQVAAISFDIAQKVLIEKLSEADMQKESVQKALKEISFN